MGHQNLNGGVPHIDQQLAEIGIARQPVRSKRVAGTVLGSFLVACKGICCLSTHGKWKRAGIAPGAPRAIKDFVLSRFLLL